MNSKNLLHYCYSLVHPEGVVQADQVFWQQKKWSVFSVSRVHEHDGFTVSAKLCLSLCSCKWLKPNLLILLQTGHKYHTYCTIHTYCLIKAKSFLWKIAKESLFLISESSLLPTLTVNGKKKFLKSSVLQHKVLKQKAFSFIYCSLEI